MNETLVEEMSDAKIIGQVVGLGSNKKNLTKLANDNIVHIRKLLRLFDGIQAMVSNAEEDSFMVQEQPDAFVHSHKILEEFVKRYDEGRFV